MLVKELVAKLQAVNPEARVFMGYYSNVVVTRPADVEEISSEDQIGSCWFRVDVGDVVILTDL